MDMGKDVPEEERRARVLVEKKTVLNLVDAFCVAVKHYLRGESGMMCTLKIFMAFDDALSQTFITRICITGLNTFQHTRYPWVYRLLAIFQAIRLLLQSLSHSGNTSKLSSNASPMTVARGPSL